jgi:hypothetical protein
LGLSLNGSSLPLAEPPARLPAAGSAATLIAKLPVAAAGRLAELSVAAGGSSSSSGAGALRVAVPAAGYAARCLAGCQAAAGPAPATASLRVWAAPGAALSTADLVAVTCRAARPELDPAGEGVCAVSGFTAAAAEAAAECAGGGTCLDVTVQYAWLPASAAPSAASSCNVNGDVETLLVVTCGRAGTLAAGVSFRRGAAALAARFSDDLGGLVIELDRAPRASAGGPGWAGWCAALLRSAGGRLGRGARCGRAGPASGEVRFGSGAGVGVGDVVDVAGWIAGASEAEVVDETLWRKLKVAFFLPFSRTCRPRRHLRCVDPPHLLFCGRDAVEEAQGGLHSPSPL